MLGKKLKYNPLAKITIIKILIMLKVFGGVIGGIVIHHVVFETYLESSNMAKKVLKNKDDTIASLKCDVERQHRDAEYYKQSSITLNNELLELKATHQKVVNEFKHKVITVPKTPTKKGYKGFSRDMIARMGTSFKYDGTEFVMDPTNIELKKCGMHYCTFPLYATQQYSRPDDVYAEVEVGGKIIHDSDGILSVCSHMKIIRFLSKEEMMKLSTGKVIGNGIEKHYHNGEFHNLDGPAVRYASGEKMFFLNGREVSETDVIKARQTKNNDKSWWFSLWSYPTWIVGCFW